MNIEKLQKRLSSLGSKFSKKQQNLDVEIAECVEEI